MMQPPRLVGFEVDVTDGPRRVGSEIRWSVRLDGGTPAELCVLSPELAREESVRRRYVRDVARVFADKPPGVAEVLKVWSEPPVVAVGVVGGNQLVETPSPGRLVKVPSGETLEDWLARRAPAPLDEIVDVITRVGRVVSAVHRAGHVLRDLVPREVVLSDPPVLTVSFLARVDLLSTRTAASLVLEGSPYAAPEQVLKTVVDRRADVYTLAVFAYRALTGALPFPENVGFFRAAQSRPADVTKLRPDTPAGWGEAIARCLAYDPVERLDGVESLLDALAGRGSLELRTRVCCQSCHVPLRPEQRLCLSCGKEAVQFFAPGDEDGAYGVVLRKLDEGAETLARLRAVLMRLHSGPLPALNFIIGDVRMYSKRELAEGIRLPAWLFASLTQATAERIAEHLAAEGFKAQARRHGDAADVVASGRRRGAVWTSVFLGVGALVAGLAVAAGEFAVAVVGGSVLAGIAVVAGVVAAREHRRKLDAFSPELQLRQTPAALPASDPWVRRLAALLDLEPSVDLREQIGELALAIQRLVDHRARNVAEADEIDRRVAPVEALVELLEAQVRAVVRIDGELAELDEGAIVRALAASSARAEEPTARESLLAGLDDLRALEDQRAARFGALLEAATLLRRAVDRGLSVHDEAAQREREIEAVLAVLR